MTQEEFDRRIAVVVKMTASLLGGSGVDSKSPAAGGMSQSEAVAFYEHVVEALDTRLEEMIEEWHPASTPSARQAGGTSPASSGTSPGTLREPNKEEKDGLG